MPWSRGERLADNAEASWQQVPEIMRVKVTVHWALRHPVVTLSVEGLHD